VTVPRVEDSTGASFDALRDVLLSEERDRIGQMEVRLNDPKIRASELAGVMNDAMLLASKDARFARVLAPTVEKSLFESVRANPEGLADVLFPVLMPAIRRIVSTLIERSFENLNRVLEVSVSPRSFAWRLESFRTGKPFGEIVLFHTISYRVEQVLLIHRETGLLLAQVGVSVSAEADLVSAMLTAIQDFARDSFQMEDENIRTFRIGDLTVLVETSPHGTLAAAVRGSPPPSLTDTIAVALETVEMRFGSALNGFQGDTSSFEDTKPILEMCLSVEYAGQATPKAKAAPNPMARLVSPVLLLLFLSLGLWFGWSMYQNIRWNNAVQKLRQEPGILIIEDSKNRLVGLRDPFAKDPQGILTSQGYSSIPQVWGEYLSFDSSLVLARAIKAIEPASSTMVELQGQTLVFSGQATEAWLKRVKLIARGLSGISGVDSRALELVKAEQK
jgi:hypothetical protein